jgi:ABC-type uncharacterized transport system auxiliary subunit
MSVWPLILAGCGDQAYDKNYYLLGATRQAESIKTETNHLLEIRRFTIDSAFNGQGFVYRTGQFEYESDFYNEFLISPSAMVTEKTRNWLSGSGLFKKVLDVGSQIDPTHILEGNIMALYGDFRDSASPEAIIEIRIFLLRAQANQELVPLFGKTYKSSVAMESKGPEALVQSLDRSLEGILSNLEKDLAEELAGLTEG